MKSNVIDFAFAKTRQQNESRSGRVMAGGFHDRFATAFAGVHPDSKRPMYYGDVMAGLSIAGDESGLSIAGAEKNALNTHALLSQINQNQAAIAALTAQVQSLGTQVQQVGTSEANEEQLLSRRKTGALAGDQAVLLHEQRGPKRHLLFAIATPTVVASGGTSVMSGSPQKPFQPNRMIIGATGLAVASAGTLGLLVNSIFIGADLQLVNVPGGASGIPVEYFAYNAFDAIFQFDAAYPAITMSVGLVNPTTSITANPVSAGVSGRAVSRI